MDAHLATAARAIARSARLVVFTGAGVSKESGIPTFREPETGSGRRYDPMELATPEAYRATRRSSGAGTSTASARRRRLSRTPVTSPSPSSRSCCREVVVITQNIDGLHQRAGSSHVIELHGSMHRFSCIHGRHTRLRLRGLRRPGRRSRHAARECGDYLRPEVVWFGEGLPPRRSAAAQQLSASCDVMLVVGHLRRGLSRRRHADHRQGGRRHGHRREPGARRPGGPSRPLPQRPGRRGAAGARGVGAGAALTAGSRAWPRRRARASARLARLETRRRSGAPPRRCAALAVSGRLASSTQSTYVRGAVPS